MTVGRNVLKVVRAESQAAWRLRLLIFIAVVVVLSLALQFVILNAVRG